MGWSYYPRMLIENVVDTKKLRLSWWRHKWTNLWYIIIGNTLFFPTWIYYCGILDIIVSPSGCCRNMDTYLWFPNTSILITWLLPLLSLHFLWRIHTLFSKYYTNLSPKKNLFIHVIFWFCCIFGIKILHKPKTMMVSVNEKIKHQLEGMN